MGSSGSASFTKESARVGFLQKQSVDRVGNKEKRVGSLHGGVSIYRNCGYCSYDMYVYICSTSQCFAYLTIW